MFLFLKKHTLFLKIPALFLSTYFMLLEPLSHAETFSGLRTALGHTPREVSSRVLADPHAQAFNLPEHLGKVEEFAAGTSGRTVFYIQDAHDSLEAQENIAKIIQELVAKHGVQTVFEEGYEGPVPTEEYFGWIKDPVKKQKFAYFLMDQLRLGGAEYAHINRHRAEGIGHREKTSSLSALRSLPSADFKLIGADSIKLHLENVKAYKDYAPKQADAQKDLKAIEEKLRELIQKFASEEFKEWLRLRDKHESGKLDLLEYVRRTKSIGIRGLGLGASQKPTPNTPYLTPTLSLILAVESSKNTKLADQLRGITGEMIFEELEQLEVETAKTLLKEEREQKAFEYLKQILLLQKLNRLGVSEEEFKWIRKILVQIKTEKIADFIFAQDQKSFVLSKAWEQVIPGAVKFYELALKRERSIEKALLAYSVERIADSKQTQEKDFLNAKRYPLNAILVFGGFHKSGIKEILKRRGDSYYVITPHISKASKRHQDYYTNLMSGGLHPYEKSLGVVSRAAVIPRAVEIMSQSEVRKLAERFFALEKTSPELASRELIQLRSEIRKKSNFYSGPTFKRKTFLINAQNKEKVDAQIRVVGYRERQTELQDVKKEGKNNRKNIGILALETLPFLRPSELQGQLYFYTANDSGYELIVENFFTQRENRKTIGINRRYQYGGYRLLQAMALLSKNFTKTKHAFEFICKKDNPEGLAFYKSLEMHGLKFQDTGENIRWYLEKSDIDRFVSGIEAYIEDEMNRSEMRVEMDETFWTEMKSIITATRVTKYRIQLQTFFDRAAEHPEWGKVQFSSELSTSIFQFALSEKKLEEIFTAWRFALERNKSKGPQSKVLNGIIEKANEEDGLVIQILGARIKNGVDETTLMTGAGAVDFEGNQIITWVYREEGKVLGYITVNVDIHLGVADIVQRAVASSHEKRGIGTELLNHAMREIQTRFKISKFIRASENLVSKLGFNSVDRFPNLPRGMKNGSGVIPYYVQGMSGEDFVRFLLKKQYFLKRWEIFSKGLLESRPQDFREGIRPLQAWLQLNQLEFLGNSESIEQAVAKHPGKGIYSVIAMSFMLARGQFSQITQNEFDGVNALFYAPKLSWNKNGKPFGTSLQMAKDWLDSGVGYWKEGNAFRLRAFAQAKQGNFGLVRRYIYWFRHFYGEQFGLDQTPNISFRKLSEEKFEFSFGGDKVAIQDAYVFNPVRSEMRFNRPRVRTLLTLAISPVAIFTILLLKDSFLQATELIEPIYWSESDLPTALKNLGDFMIEVLPKWKQSAIDKVKEHPWLAEHPEIIYAILPMMFFWSYEVLRSFFRITGYLFKQNRSLANNKSSLRSRSEVRNPEINEQEERFLKKQSLAQTGQNHSPKQSKRSELRKPDNPREYSREELLQAIKQRSENPKEVVRLITQALGRSLIEFAPPDVAPLTLYRTLDKKTRVIETQMKVINRVVRGLQEAYVEDGRLTPQEIEIFVGKPYGRLTRDDFLAAIKNLHSDEEKLINLFFIQSGMSKMDLAKKMHISVRKIHRMLQNPPQRLVGPDELDKFIAVFKEYYQSEGVLVKRLSHQRIYRIDIDKAFPARLTSEALLKELKGQPLHVMIRKLREHKGIRQYELDLQSVPYLLSHVEKGDRPFFDLFRRIKETLSKAYEKEGLSGEVELMLKAAYANLDHEAILEEIAEIKQQVSLADRAEILKIFSILVDITANELAEELGVSDRTVERYLAGTHYPSPENLNSLIVIFQRRFRSMRQVSTKVPSHNEVGDAIRILRKDSRSEMRSKEAHSLGMSGKEMHGQFKGQPLHLIIRHLRMRKNLPQKALGTASYISAVESGAKKMGWKPFLRARAELIKAYEKDRLAFEVQLLLDAAYAKKDHKAMINEISEINARPSLRERAEILSIFNILGAIDINELARAIGVTSRTIARYMNGESVPIHPNWIAMKDFYVKKLRENGVQMSESEVESALSGLHQDPRSEMRLGDLETRYKKAIYKNFMARGSFPATLTDDELLEVVSRSQNSMFRFDALQTIIDRRLYRNHPDILWMALSDPSHSVRRDAAKFLAEFGVEKVFEFYRKPRIHVSRDPRLQPLQRYDANEARTKARLASLFAFAKFASPNSREKIVTKLVHPASEQGLADWENVTFSPKLVIQELGQDQELDPIQGLRFIYHFRKIDWGGISRIADAWDGWMNLWGISAPGLRSVIIPFPQNDATTSVSYTSRSEVRVPKIKTKINRFESNPLRVGNEGTLKTLLAMIKKDGAVFIHSLSGSGKTTWFYNQEEKVTYINLQDVSVGVEKLMARIAEVFAIEYVDEKDLVSKLKEKLGERILVFDESAGFLLAPETAQFFARLIDQYQIPILFVNPSILRDTLNTTALLNQSLKRPIQTVPLALPSIEDYQKTLNQIIHKDIDRQKGRLEKKGMNWNSVEQDVMSRIPLIYNLSGGHWQMTERIMNGIRDAMSDTKSESWNEFKKVRTWQDLLLWNVKYKISPTTGYFTDILSNVFKGIGNKDLSLQVFLRFLKPTPISSVLEWTEEEKAWVQTFLNISLLTIEDENLRLNCRYFNTESWQLFTRRSEVRLWEGKKAERNLAGFFENLQTGFVVINAAIQRFKIILGGNRGNDHPDKSVKPIDFIFKSPHFIFNPLYFMFQSESFKFEIAHFCFEIFKFVFKISKFISKIIHSLAKDLKLALQTFNKDFELTFAGVFVAWIFNFLDHKTISFMNEVKRSLSGLPGLVNIYLTNIYNSFNEYYGQIRVSRSELRYQNYQNLLDRLVRDWKEIKKHGAFIFDVSGTLRGKGPISAEMAELLAWLLDQGIHIGLVSGISTEVLHDQILEPIFASLEAHGKNPIDYFSQITVYGGAGALKLTLSPQEEYILDDKYSERFVIPAETEKRVNALIKEFFTKEDIRKFLEENREELFKRAENQKGGSYKLNDWKTPEFVGDRYWRSHDVGRIMQVPALLATNDTKGRLLHWLLTFLPPIKGRHLIKEMIAYVQPKLRKEDEIIFQEANLSALHITHSGVSKGEAVQDHTTYSGRAKKLTFYFDDDFSKTEEHTGVGESVTLIEGFNESTISVGRGKRLGRSQVAYHIGSDPGASEDHNRGPSKIIKLFQDLKARVSTRSELRSESAAKLDETEIQRLIAEIKTYQNEIKDREWMLHEIEKAMSDLDNQRVPRVKFTTFLGVLALFVAATLINTRNQYQKLESYLWVLVPLILAGLGMLLIRVVNQAFLNPMIQMAKARLAIDEDKKVWERKVDDLRAQILTQSDLEKDSLQKRIEAFKEPILKQKIHAVFKGGGARVLAQVGMLKEFAKRGVEIVSVAGTSGGAWLAAMVAIGYTPEEIEQKAITSDFKEFQDMSHPLENARAKGMFGIERLNEWNQKLIREKDKKERDITFKELAKERDMPFSAIITVTRPGSNKKEMFELNQDTAPDLPLYWAMTLSQTLSPFFTPKKVDAYLANLIKGIPEGSIIEDGIWAGVLGCGFPMFVHDPLKRPSDGFRVVGFLTENPTGKVNTWLSPISEKITYKILPFLKGVSKISKFNDALDGHDKEIKLAFPFAEYVSVPVQAGALQLGMHFAQKLKLIQAGQASARDFLKTFRSELRNSDKKQETLSLEQIFQRLQTHMRSNLPVALMVQNGTPNPYFLAGNIREVALLDSGATKLQVTMSGRYGVWNRNGEPKNPSEALGLSGNSWTAGENSLSKLPHLNVLGIYGAHSKRLPPTIYQFLDKRIRKNPPNLTIRSEVRKDERDMREVIREAHKIFDVYRENPHTKVLLRTSEQKQFSPYKAKLDEIWEAYYDKPFSLQEFLDAEKAIAAALNRFVNDDTIQNNSTAGQIFYDQVWKPLTELKERYERLVQSMALISKESSLQFSPSFFEVFFLVQINELMMKQIFSLYTSSKWQKITQINGIQEQQFFGLVFEYFFRDFSWTSNQEEGIFEVFSKIEKPFDQLIEIYGKDYDIRSAKLLERVQQLRTDLNAIFDDLNLSDLDQVQKILHCFDQIKTFALHAYFLERLTQTQASESQQAWLSILAAIHEWAHDLRPERWSYGWDYELGDITTFLKKAVNDATSEYALDEPDASRSEMRTNQDNFTIVKAQPSELPVLRKRAEELREIHAPRPEHWFSEEAQVFHMFDYVVRILKRESFDLNLRVWVAKNNQDQAEGFLIGKVVENSRLEVEAGIREKLEGKIFHFNDIVINKLIKNPLLASRLYRRAVQDLQDENVQHLVFEVEDVNRTALRFGYAMARRIKLPFRVLYQTTFPAFAAGATTIRVYHIHLKPETEPVANLPEPISLDIPASEISDYISELVKTSKIKIQSPFIRTFSASDARSEVRLAREKSHEAHPRQRFYSLKSIQDLRRLCFEQISGLMPNDVQEKIFSRLPEKDHLILYGKYSVRHDHPRSIQTLFAEYRTGLELEFDHTEEGVWIVEKHEETEKFPLRSLKDLENLFKAYQIPYTPKRFSTHGTPAHLQVLNGYKTPQNVYPHSQQLIQDIFKSFHPDLVVKFSDHNGAHVEISPKSRSEVRRGQYKLTGVDSKIFGVDQLEFFQRVYPFVNEDSFLTNFHEVMKFVRSVSNYIKTYKDHSSQNDLRILHVGPSSGSAAVAVLNGLIHQRKGRLSMDLVEIDGEAAENVSRNIELFFEAKKGRGLTYQRKENIFSFQFEELEGQIEVHHKDYRSFQPRDRQKYHFAFFDSPRLDPSRINQPKMSVLIPVSVYQDIVGKMSEELAAHGIMLIGGFSAERKWLKPVLSETSSIKSTIHLSGSAQMSLIPERIIFKIQKNGELRSEARRTASLFPIRTASGLWVPKATSPQDRWANLNFDAIETIVRTKISNSDRIRFIEGGKSMGKFGDPLLTSTHETYWVISHLPIPQNKKEVTIVDLGSGSGIFLIRAAHVLGRMYPETQFHFIGLEGDPNSFNESMVYRAKAEDQHFIPSNCDLKFIKGDYRKTGPDILKKADLVYYYDPGSMKERGELVETAPIAAKTLNQYLPKKSVVIEYGSRYLGQAFEKSSRLFFEERFPRFYKSKRDMFQIYRFVPQTDGIDRGKSISFGSGKRRYYPDLTPHAQRSEVRKPHENARTGQPPGYPRRFPVPEGTDWDHLPEDYKPALYPAPSVINNAMDNFTPEQLAENPNIGYADPRDPELLRKILSERTSAEGARAYGPDGEFRNPRGPTGLVGGDLGKKGPNDAVDWIRTRYNPKTGQLEVLAILRRDAQKWALPGGFKYRAENDFDTGRRKLREETGVIGGAAEILVPREYADDWRNADDRWIESAVFHEHVSYEESEKFPLSHDRESFIVRWLPIKTNLHKFFASHGAYLEKVLVKFQHQAFQTENSKSQKITAHPVVEKLKHKLNFNAKTYQDYMRRLSRHESWNFETAFMEAMLQSVQLYYRSGSWQEYLVKNHDPKRKEFIKAGEPLFDPEGALDKTGFYESPYFLDDIVKRFLLSEVLVGEEQGSLAPIHFNGGLADPSSPEYAAFLKAKNFVQREMVIPISRHFLEGGVYIPSLDFKGHKRGLLKLLTFFTSTIIEETLMSIIFPLIISAFLYFIAHAFGLYDAAQKMNDEKFVFFRDLFFTILVVRYLFKPVFLSFDRFVEKEHKDFYQKLFVRKVLGSSRKTHRIAGQKFLSQMEDLESRIVKRSELRFHSKPMIYKTAKMIFKGMATRDSFDSLTDMAEALLESNLETDQETLVIAMLKDLADENPGYFSKCSTRWQKSQTRRNNLWKFITFGFGNAWPFPTQSDRYLSLLRLVHVQQRGHFIERESRERAQRTLSGMAARQVDAFSLEAMAQHYEKNLRSAWMQSDHFFMDHLIRELSTSEFSPLDRKRVLMSYFVAGGISRLRQAKKIQNRKYVERVHISARTYWQAALHQVLTLQRQFEAGKSEVNFGLSSQNIEQIIEFIEKTRDQSTAERLRRELDQLEEAVFSGITRELRALVQEKSTPDPRGEKNVEIENYRSNKNRPVQQLLYEVLSATPDVLEELSEIQHLAYLEGLDNRMNSEASSSASYQRSPFVDARLFDQNFNAVTAPELIRSLADKDASGKPFREVQSFLGNFGVEGHTPSQDMAEDSKIKFYHLKVVQHYLGGVISRERARNGILDFYRIGKKVTDNSHLHHDLTRLGATSKDNGLIEEQLKKVDELKRVQNQLKALMEKHANKPRLPQKVAAQKAALEARGESLKESMSIVVSPFGVPWRYLMELIAHLGVLSDQKRQGLLSLQSSVAPLVGILNDKHFFDEFEAESFDEYWRQNEPGMSAQEFFKPFGENLTLTQKKTILKLRKLVRYNAAIRSLYGNQLRIFDQSNRTFDWLAQQQPVLLGINWLVLDRFIHELGYEHDPRFQDVLLLGRSAFEKQKLHQHGHGTLSDIIRTSPLKRSEVRSQRRSSLQQVYRKTEMNSAVALYLSADDLVNRSELRTEAFAIGYRDYARLIIYHADKLSEKAYQMFSQLKSVRLVTGGIEKARAEYGRENTANQIEIVTGPGYIPAPLGKAVFLVEQPIDLWAALRQAVSDQTIQGVSRIQGVYRIVDESLRSFLQQARNLLVIRMSA